MTDKRKKARRRFCAACPHAESRHSQEAGCLAAASRKQPEMFCACAKFSERASNIRRAR